MATTVARISQRVNLVDVNVKIEFYLFFTDYDQIRVIVCLVNWTLSAEGSDDLQIAQVRYQNHKGASSFVFTVCVHNTRVLTYVSWLIPF